MLYEKNNDAREALYSSLGETDTDVIGQAINPFFMGGPEWPSLRQAWKIIRKESSTAIASIGLSDPFEDWDVVNSGFGIEIIGETSDGMSDPMNSWLFRLVWNASQQAACDGEFDEKFNRLGNFTMELDASDAGLEEFQNDQGMVGIMFGNLHPDIPESVEFPSGTISLIAVKILTPEELNLVIEERAKGRARLAKLFAEQGSYHLSSVDRESVI